MGPCDHAQRPNHASEGTPENAPIAYTPWPMCAATADAIWLPTVAHVGAAARIRGAKLEAMTTARVVPPERKTAIRGVTRRRRASSHQV